MAKKVIYRRNVKGFSDQFRYDFISSERFRRELRAEKVTLKERTREYIKCFGSESLPHKRARLTVLHLPQGATLKHKRGYEYQVLLGGYDAELGDIANTFEEVTIFGDRASFNKIEELISRYEQKLSRPSKAQNF